MHLSRLTLSHFRNHRLADITLTPEPVVLYGPNGSGKTNILEAISFLSVGRGLRSAKLTDLGEKVALNEEDVPRLKPSAQKPWSLSAVLKDESSTVRLSSSFIQDKRINHIQGETVKSVADFSEWLSVLWLTPEHDRLFIDSSKVRRRFLDRLVFAYDPLHATRLIEYDAAMKERLAILSKSYDDRWLTAIEEKMAGHAVSIAFARQTLLNRLDDASKDLCSFFPKFSCRHKGEFESSLYDKKAVEWEMWFQEQWKFLRSRDRDAHMTTLGVHRSDFSVVHSQKGEGHMCSTGEQKILLMGIMLAFLVGRLQWDKKLVVMLFDECVSHFDFHHRVVLFEQIQLLHDEKRYSGSFHAFMTGTEKELFLPLQNKANFYYVSPSFTQKGDASL